MKHLKIKPDDVLIDTQVQRVLDTARAVAMGKKFEANLLGVPVLSRRRGGLLYVLDGQHRIEAAKRSGLAQTPILCEVHEDLSLEQEASLFLRLNGGRTAIRAYDKWRVRLTAKEPTALAIQRVANKLGLSVSTYKGKGHICAIQALDAVFPSGNLETTLRVLTAWRDGDADAYDGTLIRGMSAFLIGFENQLAESELVKKLQPTSTHVVFSRMKVVQHDIDCGRREAAVRAFLDVYNSGRAPKKQLRLGDAKAGRSGS